MVCEKFLLLVGAVQAMKEALAVFPELSNPDRWESTMSDMGAQKLRDNEESVLYAILQHGWVALHAFLEKVGLVKRPTIVLTMLLHVIQTRYEGFGDNRYEISDSQGFRGILDTLDPAGVSDRDKKLLIQIKELVEWEARWAAACDDFLGKVWWFASPKKVGYVKVWWS